ncbi:MAG: LysR family transcriptional regulator [Caulobacteraceae bacterium]
MPMQESAPSVVIGRQRVDWGDLRVFLAVAETGSFSGAAKLLGLTQPTVSRRLEDLEARLSVRLVNRGAHGVALSEAGELIRDHVITMERSAQAIERLALGRDKRDEGRVRISAPDGLAAFWLAPRLPEFQRENPKISVSLDAGLWPGDEMRGESDLSLRFDESKHADDVVTRIATYHYCLFASPEYIRLYGAPRTLAEVADHRVVHHVAQRHQTETWHPKAGALQALWNRQIETNSSAAALVAIRSGAGIGALPTAALTVAPELIMISDGPLAKLTLWLVHHREARNTERTRRVMDWLKRVFDNRANPWYREEYVSPADFPSSAEESETSLAVPQTAGLAREAG